ncbi:hypothetical protein ACFX19_038744 [Malus domestica]
MSCSARTDLTKENKQLKSEKSSLEVVLAQGQADFYKLGCIVHFLGMSFDYTFSDKDLKLFVISSKDLLNFSFKSAIGGAPEDQAAKASTVEGSVAQGG